MVSSCVRVAAAHAVVPRPDVQQGLMGCDGIHHTLGRKANDLAVFSFIHECRVLLLLEAGMEENEREAASSR